MSDYNVEIGRRIYEKRKQKCMSREQMLEYVNISEVYLGMIERGKRGTSIEHMVQIANALGMSMDYLILGREKAFDKGNDMSKATENMSSDERKLLEKIAQRIKLNTISGDSLKTVLELVDLFVQYEKHRIPSET